MAFTLLQLQFKKKFNEKKNWPKMQATRIERRLSAHKSGALPSDLIRGWKMFSSQFMVKLGFWHLHPHALSPFSYKSLKRMVYLYKIVTNAPFHEINNLVPNFQPQYSYRINHKRNNATSHCTKIFSCAKKLAEFKI